jgi:hypothetical protein
LFNTNSLSLPDHSLFRYVALPEQRRPNTRISTTQRGLLVFPRNRLSTRRAFASGGLARRLAAAGR